MRTERQRALFSKHLSDKPYDDGEVLAFVVGGEDDGVLVSIRGRILALHAQGRVALERVHAFAALFPVSGSICPHARH